LINKSNQHSKDNYQSGSLDVLRVDWGMQASTHLPLPPLHPSVGSTGGLVSLIVFVSCNQEHGYAFHVFTERASGKMIIRSINLIAVFSHPKIY